MPRWMGAAATTVSLLGLQMVPPHLTRSRPLPGGHRTHALLPAYPYHAALPQLAEVPCPACPAAAAG